ncbi:MAG: T9SS type A sorting domain-containing protein [Bacteroidetes bacterium]|nr:T9SS type A sorting domain-containing protein [Bacteroidota bacterium]
MKKHLYFLSLLVIITVFQAKSQEVIAVINEPNVVLLDPFDGSVLNSAFIDLTPLNQGQPKDITQVGEEIWITDQTADRIDRFDLTGTFLSTINTGLDNIKGLAIIGSEVWVTNAGTNNGAPGSAIVRLDFQGNALGNFPTVGSSFDILDVGNNEVYIAYIGNDTRIERRDYQGNLLGDLVQTGVVTFIQQMALSPNNNTVFAAVFSNNGANIAGLYEFSRADGSIVDFWQEGSLRGVMPLGNGQMLLSAGTNYGVKILDPTSGNTTQLWPESSQYFSKLNLSPCNTPPTPVGAANQTFNEGATIEDIVVDPSDVIWFATESDALNNINPLAPGTLLDNATYYGIQIVDGCPSLPLAVAVTINVLGLSEWEDGVIKMAPNPAVDVVNFSASNFIQSYSLFNNMGQILIERSVQGFDGRIDVSALPSGIYFIKFFSKVGQKNVPLIRQ